MIVRDGVRRQLFKVSRLIRTTLPSNLAKIIGGGWLAPKGDARKSDVKNASEPSLVADSLEKSQWTG